MPKKLIRQFEILENERKEVLQMLEGVADEQFNKNPSAEKWSAAQVLSHIYMAESQTLASIQWRLANKKSFPRVKWLAYIVIYYVVFTFKIKLKRKAPEFVAKVPEYTAKEALLNLWEQNRKDWKTFLGEFPDRLTHRIVFKHPVMGYLSLPLTMVFMINHLQLHKEQIKKTLQTV